MDNPGKSNRPQDSMPDSGDGHDWLATTGAVSAGTVLAALRDSSSGLGAPFAQPILLFERARVVGTLHIRDIDFICEAIEPVEREVFRSFPSASVLYSFQMAGLKTRT